MVTIPLIQHRDPGSVFAFSAGRPVSVSQFLRDVAHLALALPNKRHILNLCTDRYRFAVGFAAALLREQTSLLPPNYTPNFVERLGKCYPDLYCLADGEIDFQLVEVMHYPQLSETDDTVHAIPEHPGGTASGLGFYFGFHRPTGRASKIVGQPVPGRACRSGESGHCAQFRHGGVGYGSGAAHVRSGIMYVACLAERLGTGSRKTVLSGGYLRATRSAPAAALSGHNAGALAHLVVRQRWNSLPSSSYCVPPRILHRNWRAKPKRVLPLRCTRSMAAPKRAW